MPSIGITVFLFAYLTATVKSAATGSIRAADTIVVGMGPAGLAALSKLARHGVKVLGLEAADRIGGRVYTQPNPDGAGVIELGAEWTMEYILRNTTLVQDNDYMRMTLPHFLMASILQGSSSLIPEEWDDASNFNENDQYLFTLMKTNGYKTLFDLLLNKTRNGNGLSNSEIKLNKQVSKIVWSNDPAVNIIVKCKDGTEYTAKNVIVTVSLGVLKVSHATLFQPKLPMDKISAIEHIPMDVLNKIILIFNQEDVWWNDCQTLFDYTWKEEDVENITEREQWMTSVALVSRTLGTNNVLVIWISGERAKDIETLSDEEIEEQSKKLLSIYMSKAIPVPKKIIRSAWYTNPLTRGSHSFDKLEVPRNTEMRERLGAPLLDSANSPRVLFAGEATNPTHPSTVYAGLETGIREANRLLGISTQGVI